MSDNPSGTQTGGRTAAERELVFFGRVLASVTHDVKNCLAIINEKAGLAEDLMLMADKGRALDPARLGNLAASIKAQVKRADRIVKNANTLAHSVDAPNSRLDVGNLLGLVCELYRRFADRAEVRLDLTPPEVPIMATGFAFAYIRLFSGLLDAGLAAPQMDKTLRLSLAQQGSGAELAILGLAPEFAPSPETAALAAAMNVRLVIDAAGGRLTAELPGGAVV